MAGVDVPLLAAVCSLCMGTVTRRRFFLSPVDPLRILALKEAAWGYMVATLTKIDVMSEPEAVVFWTTISIWWAGWWILGQRWGESFRRIMAAVWFKVANLSTAERYSLFALFTFGTAVTLVATHLSGGGGDNRLAVAKLIRPVEGFTTLLLPITLGVLMTSGRSRWRWFMLAVIGGALIYSGGRSALLSFLVPLTGLHLIKRISISIRKALLLIGIAATGALIATVVNYGVTDPLGAAELLLSRMVNDGDVYVDAFPDIVYLTDTTSLSAYLFGPLIKAVGSQVHVDQALGSQLFYLITGEDGPNGPNPHWPVVLLAYGVNKAAPVVALTCILTVLVVWFKAKLITARYVRRVAAPLVLPLGMFALQYPQYAFSDPSSPWIYFVHVLIVTFAWSAAALVYDRILPISTHGRHARRSKPVGLETAL